MMIEAYIGKPWQSGAQGPDAFDCYGLVRAVLRECCGVDAPLVAFDASRSADCLRTVEEQRRRHVWREIAAPQPWAVALMSHGRRPHHVGIALPDGSLLHSMEGAGVVRQTLPALRMHGWNVLQWLAWNGSAGDEVQA